MPYPMDVWSGQVIIFGLENLNVSRIMVVDDEVVNNGIEKSGFETCEHRQVWNSISCQLRKQQQKYPCW